MTKDTNNFFSRCVSVFNRNRLGTKLIPTKPNSLVPMPTSPTMTRKQAYELIRESQPKSQPIVLVCDTSASMKSRAVTCTKLDLLHQTLDILATRLPHESRVLEFDNNVREFHLRKGLRFVASGGTNLLGALQFLNSINLNHAILITDGHPACPDESLRFASHLIQRVDAIFCGPADDEYGIGFLRRLTETTGGNILTCDLTTQSNPLALVNSVQKVLALPAPPRKSDI